MSVHCHRCEVRAKCEALPYGIVDCQDNARRFDLHFATITPLRGARQCAVCEADGPRCGSIGVPVPTPCPHRKPATKPARGMVAP